ncbi:MAG TPA: Wzz/FepE/Etk N-terminal domain-containing protein [Blastocatellia bacterium]
MPEEIPLNQYIGHIWRAKWLILLAAIAAGGAVGAYQYRRPAVFTSQALLQVGRVWKEPLEDPYLTAELINSPSFLRELAPKLGAKSGVVKRSIHAATISAGPQRASYPILVSITATADSASDAATFAKVVAEEVIARHNVLYDESLKPHQDYRKQLESILAPTGVFAPSEKKTTDSKDFGSDAAPGPHAPASAGPAPPISEALAKTLHDYDEVRSFNESPSITQRTHLISDVAPGASSKEPVTSPAAIAAVLAALIAGAAAVAVGVVSAPTISSRSSLPHANPQDLPDATIS